MRPLILLILLAPTLHAADWPEYLGPSRNGLSNETGIARSWPADGPKLLWKKSVGTGWSSPVVAGGKLILFHRIENEEVVECLDAENGKPLWKQSYRTRYTDDFGFDNGPRSTPLIYKDQVYTLGADGDLSAFGFAKGELLWQRNINKDFDVPKSFFGVATSPMMLAGRLIINVGSKKAGVVAFDPTNGKDLWKSGDDAVSYSSPVAATIDNEELAVFFTRNGLLALQPKDGKEVYRFAWRPRLNASVNAASPIVFENRIFVSSSYNTGGVVLQPKKGELEEIWKNDTSMSCHYNTPILWKKHLYGIDGRQEGGQAQLRCIDWQTGKVLWKKEAYGCATLTYVDGLILAMAETGELILFQPNPEKYQELARAAILQKPVRAATALSAGKFYARDGSKLIAVQVSK